MKNFLIIFLEMLVTLPSWYIVGGHWWRPQWRHVSGANHPDSIGRHLSSDNHTRLVSTDTGWNDGVPSSFRHRVVINSAIATSTEHASEQSTLLALCDTELYNKVK